MKINLMKVYLLLSLFFKFTKEIDFCRNESTIDSITKLSNGSLFLTSDEFYWILNKNNEWYERPTTENAKLIQQILPNVYKIDSVERIVNFNGIDDQICNHSDEELLIFYWFDYETNEPEIRFLVDWKQKEWEESMELIEILTSNTTAIDWNQPIDAILFYQILNSSSFEVHQEQKCIRRECNKYWNTFNDCPKFQIDSIYLEEYDSISALFYAFSGIHFKKCVKNLTESFKCEELKLISTDFFGFPSDCQSIIQISTESAEIFTETKNQYNMSTKFTKNDTKVQTKDLKNFKPKYFSTLQTKSGISLEKSYLRLILISIFMIDFGIK